MSNKGIKTTAWLYLAASQNPPEFVQNLITALAGQFMGATLQQYQSQQQQQQAASSSAQGAPAATPAGAQNSQARGNTATHPTTATQTRSTARPHVHLSPAIHGQLKIVYANFPVISLARWVRYSRNPLIQTLVNQKYVLVVLTIVY